MDRHQQIDRHSFVVRLGGVPREVQLVGCQFLAEVEIRTICEEEGFEFVGYRGVVRDADSQGDAR